MANIHDQIKEFEDEIKKTQYNKKTQHHIGLVKAKIAKLRDKIMTQAAARSKGGGGYGYTVKRSGDGTAILVGFPSVGKSTLLNKLTNANSEVGSYAFTTLDVIPGTMEYKSAKIQILDVPGIVHGAASGRGRGREVLSVMYSADMALIVVDALNPDHYPVVLKEIRDANLRLNQERPDVKIRKTANGGLHIGTTVKLTKMDKETMKKVLREFKIVNADVLVRTDIDVDELIDIIEGNKKYIPAVTVLSKVDLVDKKRLEELRKIINPDIEISVHQNYHIDELKEEIYQSFRYIRVYCKEVGKKADLGEPLILRKPASIGTMCTKLHKDFFDRFKYARIWGKSAKFDGQMISNKVHLLEDGDVVELHIR